MAPGTETYKSLGGMRKKMGAYGAGGYLLCKKGPSGFGGRSTAEQVSAGYDGKGKVVIVTGTTSGLGEETARVLALRGAHVVMAIRDVAKGEQVAAKIRAAQPGAQITAMQLDVSSLQSVRSFAEAYVRTGLPLNALIHNAGVMANPFTLSKEGHELQFATNYLGPFLLNKLLLPLLIKTARATGIQGRIVWVSSLAVDMTYPEGIRLDKIDSPEGYGAWAAYGQSKVAMVLGARELALQLKDEPVATASLHPGVIATELQRHVPGLLWAVGSFLMAPTMKTVPQGAATQVYLATAPQVESGEYYIDSNVAPCTPPTLDAVLGRKLLELSETLVAPYAQPV